MTPLLRDQPPEERERLTSVVWSAQNPRSPTCDYCGEFRPRQPLMMLRGMVLYDQCRCEARRRASRPQGEEGA